MLALDTLPDDTASLKALIAALYADNTQLAAKFGHIEQEQAVPAAEVDRLNARNEHLDHIISLLRRAHFGRSSQRLSENQIALALDNVALLFGFGALGREAGLEILQRLGNVTRALAQPIVFYAIDDCQDDEIEGQCVAKTTATPAHCQPVAQGSLATTFPCEPFGAYEPSPSHPPTLL